jgi:hypothetical protein
LLHFLYYNIVRIHQTRRVTSAMAAGVTDRMWNVADIVGLLEQRDSVKAEASNEQRIWKRSAKGPALGF